MGHYGVKLLMMVYRTAENEITGLRQNTSMLGNKKMASLEIT